MKQTSLSAFLSFKSAEMTAGVGAGAGNVISQNGDSLDNFGGQQQHQVERVLPGEVM